MIYVRCIKEMPFTKLGEVFEVDPKEAMFLTSRGNRFRDFNIRSHDLIKDGYLEEVFKCSHCDVFRSEEEGGQIFTVCDLCWEKVKNKKDCLSSKLHNRFFELVDAGDYKEIADIAKKHSLEILEKVRVEIILKDLSRYDALSMIQKALENIK